MRMNKGETVIFIDETFCGSNLTLGKKYLVLDVVANRIYIMNDRNKTPRLYRSDRFEPQSVTRNRKLSSII